jgi:hypothetical protein
MFPLTESNRLLERERGLASAIPPVKYVGLRFKGQGLTGCGASRSLQHGAPDSPQRGGVKTEEVIVTLSPSFDCLQARERVRFHGL